MDDRTQPATAPPLTRRKVLGGAAAVALTALQSPSIVVAAAERRLRVSTFGGYFERMFAEHIYPAFTKATGIAVQSIEQPEGAQFLFQLAAANKAGSPPMDICCMAAIDVLRGRAQGIWHGLDKGAIPNFSELMAKFQEPQPAFDSVAAMSW